MIEELSLLVLRCADLAASKAFYDALGLEFREERHGTGPAHFSCQLGTLVFELYPAAEPSSSLERLGFRVLDVEAVTSAALRAGGRLERPGVLVDPDGRKIELLGFRAPVVRWAVWRQDDHGNRFLISRGHSRTEAERLCLEFEARGHKQTYWASPETNE
jgi:catechol 2,3-dioxygenase-like lactoylglutathione lyase family enzyme